MRHTSPIIRRAMFDVLRQARESHRDARSMYAMFRGMSGTDEITSYAHRLTLYGDALRAMYKTFKRYDEHEIIVKNGTLYHVNDLYINNWLRDR